MLAFDFITNEAFRKSLESDFRELTECSRATAWKAVHVLAGSIIEAVLIDHLIESGKALAKDPLKMELAELIQFCRDEGILSQKSVDLSTVIRGFRNLIHPGRVIRLNETVDEKGAVIAQKLVEIVVEEVAGRRREAYGYTAEQLTNKIESDASVMSIIGHLLKKLNPYETERLLLTVIPERYFVLDSEQFRDTRQECSHLAKAFRLAFDLAAKETKERVTQKFLNVVQEEGEYTVQMYERNLFRAGDLQFLADGERSIIKAYLLASMSKKLTSSLIQAAEGIGKFLDSEEAKVFFQALITHILPDSDELRDLSLTRLTEERSSMSDENKKWMEAWVAKLRTMYQRSNRTAFVESLDLLESWGDDVPF